MVSRPKLMSSPTIWCITPLRLTQLLLTPIPLWRSAADIVRKIVLDVVCADIGAARCSEAMEAGELPGGPIRVFRLFQSVQPKSMRIVRQ